MKLDDIKSKLRKFFRGEETEEGRWLIDRWYRNFDDKPNELTDYSDKEKEKLRQKLWADIKISTGSPQKQRRLQIHYHSPNRISWLTRIASGFIITLLALLPTLYYQGILMPEDQYIKYQIPIPMYHV